MLNILWINLWILIKFCICIDIDKMQIWMIEQYFSFIFNRVMALDWCGNFIDAQYLMDQLIIFPNFSTELYPLIDFRIVFVYAQYLVK